MLNDVSIGSYYSIKSNIHNMNPISKIICLLIFMITTLITFDPIFIALLFIFTLFVVINTKIPLNIYYKMIVNIKLFLLIIFLLFSILFFSFYVGLLILIKSILIITYLAILTLTTPTTEIVYGLEKVLNPLQKFKIKSNILALNVGIGLRFISTLIDSRNMILKSQISRGVDYRTSFSSYILSMKNVAGSSIKMASKKFKMLKEFMMIRLYSIDKVRCNFRMNKWGIFDSVLLLVHVIMLIFIIMKGVIV